MKYDRLYRNVSLRSDVDWQKICALFDAEIADAPKAKLRVIRKLNAIYYWERCHA